MSQLTLDTASPEIKELYKLALLARQQSYSPYSNYKVGAAIRTAQGKTYSGCNIENSSFGATICAERVAIQKAVSELGMIEITEIMVITDSKIPWPPCGMCRQVIAEFCKDSTVFTANLEGSFEVSSFLELFPRAFNPSYLNP